MNKFHNPESVATPISAYSHAVEVLPGARWLTVSGQIGIDSEGKLGSDTSAQSELVWCNIQRILESAGMEIVDIVKMTAYLVNSADVAEYGAVRTRFLGEHRPASTLIYVSGLANPEVTVEVEVVAAHKE